MGDFELNFFFNFGSHMDSHGNARRDDTLKFAAESREESAPPCPCGSINPEKVSARLHCMEIHPVMKLTVQ
jgi:hypothetical protein